ncbi:MAG: hypothetical protein M1308_15670 [Actinobacteria bacterium]|nr:hypothetical protein [Actinomycetota bacterium]
MCFKKVRRLLENSSKLENDSKLFEEKLELAEKELAWRRKQQECRHWNLDYDEENNKVFCKDCGKKWDRWNCLSY